MLSSVVALFILLIFTNACILEEGETTNVVNLEVTSEVDLKNQLVYVKNTIIILYNGTDILRNYLYSVDDHKLPFLVTFHDQFDKELSQKRDLSGDGLHFNVTLGKGVEHKQTYKLLCKLVYANKIVPAVKQRALEEDQLMKYEGNLHFFSPYKTKSSAVTYDLPDKVLHYSFENTERYSIEPVELIFVNNDPFLVITDLTRTISVSHFGKITIEDVVTLKNNGPDFVGPYFNDLHLSKKAATNWLYTHLPAAAEDIDFFDTIGNNSRSAVLHHSDYLTLKFKTRYPLLGGWKTYYVLQYHVPGHEHLFTKSKNNYLLQIRGVDYVLNDKVIEQAVVKIVLPEGARLLKMLVPKNLIPGDGEVSCLGGLCVFGRQTLVLKGKNLFENYVADVEIEYYFDSMYLLRAPLLISFYLEIVFVAYLCWRRCFR